MPMENWAGKGKAKSPAKLEGKDPSTSDGSVSYPLRFVVLYEK